MGAMSRPKVLILTALRIEARYVANACKSLQQMNLAVIGMGAGHLPALMDAKPDCVILAGFAGALRPDLCVGDVVIDSDGGDVVLPAGCRHGTIHGSRHVVSTTEHKRSLFASTQCLAVDMESGAVRSWAKQAGLPLVIVRAISDAAADSLPEQFLAAVDEYGSPRLGQLVLAICSKPALLPRLLKLARDARKAGNNLGRAVHQLIELNGTRWSCKAPREP